MIIIGILFCGLSWLTSFPYLYYVYTKVRKHYLYFLVGQIWNLGSQGFAIYVSTVGDGTLLIGDYSDTSLLVLGVMVMLIMSVALFVQMKILQIFSILGSLFVNSR